MIKIERKADYRVAFDMRITFELDSGVGGGGRTGR